MATDFLKLHAVCLSNMTDGLYAWLAEHLGVSADSLKAMQVGWCPVVSLKKKVSFDGWFTIPMRDATAKVTGLSLRNREGKKITYPGSKLGCFYVVNPEHETGDQGYSGGKHNWVRTMDAGVVCPVCGKPDGCLLSAENIADPKAVVCRKEKSGRPTRFGWVHIRKAEGRLSSTSPLITEGPVVTVEGMSDACAVYDLGFVAVGRPSNVAGLDILADLIRGRDVLVIGENDGPNAKGEWPGRDGAISALQTCKRVTRNVRMVMPPEGIKDLRAWKVNHKLSRDVLMGHVDDKGTERVDHLVLENDKPITLVRGFLRDKYQIGKRFMLRRWEDNWFLYDEGEGRYTTKKDPEIIQQFYLWSGDKKFETLSPKGEVQLEDLVATINVWANVKQAALADTLVVADRIPVWINNVRGPNPDDLVVFNNGIVNVPKFLAGGDDYMLETTPDLFNTTALPIPFEPDAECPTWHYVMDSSLGDDPAKIDLLQEWIGYCMTPDTTMQKMMYLRGVSGAGKGRVIEVIEQLVGKNQSCATSFADLAGPFGLSPLVGKLVCLVPDARTPRGTDTMRGLEVLLNITGNDVVSVNRKFKDQLENHRLTARITIASNTFLSVPDHAGAMLRRLNIIEFRRSFNKNPDVHLPSKLSAEIPGIAIWALHGLRRLRERGSFTIPPSSVEAMEDWKLGTNPMASFVAECTHQEADQWTLRDEVFDCYEKWAIERRLGIPTKSDFISNFPATASYVVTDTEAVAGRQQIVYRGIKLHPNAARRYLGRP